MRAIIAGGGVAGLAAAVGLRNIGFDPLVLEQAPALSPVGAGLNLWANAMKGLDFLGAGDHIRKTGVRGEEIMMYGLEEGQRLLRINAGAESAQFFGGRFYNSHRADLIDALAGRLSAEHLRLNSRIASFQETERDVAVQLESGEQICGDLLIGADGLKSTVRAQLFGERSAKFIGVMCWRGLIPSKKVQGLGVVQGVSTWIGAGRSIVMYPICGGELVTFSGYVPAEEVHRESWTTSGDVDDLHRSFAGSCENVTAILATIEQAFLTSIYFRDPLPAWSSRRVTLLGDAAHPMPPYAGSGAAMGIEDAVTLAVCLRRHGKDVTAAFQDYQSRRIPRTTRVLMLSRMNVQLTNERDTNQMRARDGRFHGLQRLDPFGRSVNTWLWGYDPVAAAEQPLSSITTPAEVLRRPEARRACNFWRGVLQLEDRLRLWTGERAAYERALLRECPAPADWQVTQLDCNGVPTLRVTLPGGEAGPVVLHLHGGGYTMGSARAAVEFAGRLAHAVGGSALVPDYRLAPEHPHPAAPDDVLSVYRWLIAQQGGPILLSGECAGGGLALGLAVAVRDAGERMPSALYLVSPFCDLTLSAPSIDANAGRDGWFNRDLLTLAAASYLHEKDPASPPVSPLYASLKDLPPLLLQAAVDEALRDDATRLADRAKQVGVDVTLELYADTVHSFVLFDFLPDTAHAIARVAAHLNSALRR